jgi:hypothetical protein
VATQRSLSGVAHDIAHHANRFGISFSPHGQALRGAGLTTTSVDLLSASPYPIGVANLLPLRTALQSLRSTAESLLGKHAFSVPAVNAIELFATPAPWDESGYILHTRALITAADGTVFDSGWLQ